MAVTSFLVALGCKIKHDPKISEPDQLAQGPLDDVWSNQLFFRRQVAPLLKGKFPFFAVCQRCEFPVQLVKIHFAVYERREWSSSGCGMLCEDCWENLQSGENRLPYYAQGLTRYKWPHEDAEKVKLAVLNGA